jgi:hypothetical protein
MESFIRSKYESKRWAMDGPVPEPESLDVADDDVRTRYPLPSLLLLLIFSILGLSRSYPNRHRYSAVDLFAPSSLFLVPHHRSRTNT